MDIKGFKKGIWVDITNLISRVSKIQMLLDPAEHDCAPPGEPRSPPGEAGRRQHYSPSEMQEFREEGPEDSQKGPCWGAESTRHFFMHTNKLACTDVRDFSIVQSLFNTTCAPYKQQSTGATTAGWVWNSDWPLLAVWSGANYLTFLCLIFLIYKMGITWKAISSVVMKSEWGSVHETFKIVHRTQVALHVFSFYC